MRGTISGGGRSVTFAELHPKISSSALVLGLLEAAAACKSWLCDTWCYWDYALCTLRECVSENKSRFLTNY